ncbi:L-serine ammonia-lyase, iron-sulfur-dependent, subunit alpha [Alkalicella caledoniensis]|uniref:L-serine dehydratase n=1 Tax=Alkalicella caledoniensis TaxID=2731377 RepID=A0A7G9WCF0_ALKCA|nr:L-serine ammonia-lyase, iron-sulfur-dependent, subunit alpha [Alkalicella caledoniensis]QNO16362.1 L-serine ammonia-lyase, iron-sulfur-dependent, subunit alpha [Alkalicella caledoniensis]
MDTLLEIVTQANTKKCKVSDIIIEVEAKRADKSVEEVIAQMEQYWQIMKDGIKKGLSPDVKSVSGLTGGDARKYYNNNKGLLGTTSMKAVAYAMAMAEVNASMGKIVATPTAGSCGILPGVLLAISEERDIEDENIVKALFTAASVGTIIAKKGTVAGAEGGCQAECGSAAAMAAAAVVELLGGSLEDMLHAVAISLKNIMGLVCDPVAGLVEVPCIKRNGGCATMAMMASDMALAGVRSVIPADEVIVAMAEVGEMMPVELKETSMAGLANTPTARNIEEKLGGN